MHCSAVLWVRSEFSLLAARRRRSSRAARKWLRRGASRAADRRDALQRGGEESSAFIHVCFVCFLIYFLFKSFLVFLEGTRNRDAIARRLLHDVGRLVLSVEMKRRSFFSFSFAISICVLL